MIQQKKKSSGFESKVSLKAQVHTKKKKKKAAVEKENEWEQKALK